MTSENSEFYKKKTLDHYNLMDRLVRKRFTDGSTADEAFVYVMEHLEKDDWRRIREYRGNASFPTFLSKVVSNLISDFSDHKYGKFHIPVWIKNMGSMWEEAYKRLGRERMSKKDVEYSMTIGKEERDPEAVREAIEVILSKIPDCGGYKKIKLLTTDPDNLINSEPVHGESQNSSSLKIQTVLNYVSLQEELFPFLTNADQTGKTESPKNNKLKLSVSSFREKLKLSAEDRIFLKMIYQDGYSVKSAGEKLNFSSSWVHKRHKQLLKRIAKALKKAGLEQELKNILSE